MLGVEANDDVTEVEEEIDVVNVFGPSDEGTIAAAAVPLHRSVTLARGPLLPVERCSRRSLAGERA